MSRLRALAKGATIAGAATAGLAGVLYGAERFAAARLRRNPDPHPDSVFRPLPFPAQSIESHDGGRINFVDSGPGRESVTFVLSHGVTLSMRTWILQLDALTARGFRVIAFDHRGHGGSHLGLDGFSVAAIGNDIDVLCDHLDLSNVVLVGHSMGGIAAQSYIAHHRTDAVKRLAGLVLLSTLPSVLTGSQAAQVGLWVERITRRTPDSTPLWANPQIGILLARFGFGANPVPSHLELVRRMMYECHRDTRVQGPRSLIGFDLVDQLASIPVPTLVVGGTADAITPPRDSIRMHAAIPSARLHMIEGGGHMLMLERSEQINDLLVDFAREVSSVANV